MYPHRIRLRGPWECEPLARAPGDDRPLPPPCRVTMPRPFAAGGLPDFAGTLRFRRRFGYPGRIDPHERVWLTFEGAGRDAAVWLNGHLLGRPSFPVSAFEFEVTGLLRERNELVVEVSVTNEPGGLWGDVAMEIRTTAFLRDVVLRAVSEDETVQLGKLVRLHIDGEVVGTSDGPLELYAVLNRVTVAYAAIETDAHGKRFHVVSDPWKWQEQSHDVRVDLVGGAVVYYRIERSL